MNYRPLQIVNTRNGWFIDGERQTYFIGLNHLDTFFIRRVQWGYVRYKAFFVVALTP